MTDVPLSFYIFIHMMTKKMTNFGHLFVVFAVTWKSP